MFVNMSSNMVTSVFCSTSTTTIAVNMTTTSTVTVMEVLCHDHHDHRCRHLLTINTVGVIIAVVAVIIHINNMYEEAEAERRKWVQAGTLQLRASAARSPNFETLTTPSADIQTRMHR